MGKEFQPMSQERRHGGGKYGGASVTGSPDRGGMQSLIGVIDTALPLRYFSGCPKKGVYISYSLFPPRGAAGEPTWQNR